MVAFVPIGYGIWYVGTVTFATAAAAYAYINREGLSESAINFYDYATGKTQTVPLEDLDIKPNTEYKTYGNSYYNESDGDLSLKDKYTFKKQSALNQQGYLAGDYVGTQQTEAIRDGRIGPSTITNPAVNPQVQELMSLQQKKNTLVSTKEWDKLDLKTKNFYEDQIRVKENNLTLTTKDAPVVVTQQSSTIPELKDRPPAIPVKTSGGSITQKQTYAIPEKVPVSAPNERESVVVNSIAGTNVEMKTKESAPPGVQSATNVGPIQPNVPPAGTYETNIGPYYNNETEDLTLSKKKPKTKIVTKIDQRNVGQNILYDLEPYTYDFTLSSISAEDYATGKFEAFADTNVVIRSSGLGKTGNAPGSELNHHIRSMRLASTVGLNSKTVTSNVHNMQFTVFEPYGTSLLNDLHDAAVAVGHSNYLKGIYLLTLRFHGYDDEGAPQTAYGPKKFFPMKIINCSFNVTGGGTEYEFDAVPYNALMLEDTVNKIDQPVNLTGSTVGELLFDLETQINKQTKIIDGKIDLSYMLRIVGGSGSQDNLTSSITKNTKNSILYMSPDMNPQATVMFNATVNHDKFSESANKVFEELNEEGKKLANELSQVGIPSQIPFGDKYSQRVYRFNGGTSILQIIRAIIDSSDYIMRQFNTDETMTIDANANGEVPWYKIEYKVPAIQVEATGTGDIHIYVIRPYYVDQYKALPDSQLPVKYNIKTIAREYNYIYTGKNQDILNFDLQYNFAFFAAAAAQRDTTPGDDSNKIAQTQVLEQTYGKVDDVQGFDTDKGLSPIESKPSDGDDRGSTQGGDQGTAIGYRTSNIIKEQLTNPQADLINLEIDILGDPFYLAQEDFNPNLAAPSITNAFELEDGSIDMNSGMVYLKINFKTPVDIDDETGRYKGLDGQGKYDTSFFGGFYQLINIESNFEEGRFTQRLQLVRLRHQEEENAQKNNNANEDKFDVQTVNEDEKSGEATIKNTSSSVSATDGDVIDQVLAESNDLTYTNTHTTTVTDLKTGSSFSNNSIGTLGYEKNYFGDGFRSAVGSSYGPAGSTVFTETKTTTVAKEQKNIGNKKITNETVVDGNKKIQTETVEQTTGGGTTIVKSEKKTGLDKYGGLTREEYYDGKTYVGFDQATGLELVDVSVADKAYRGFQKVVDECKARGGKSSQCRREGKEWKVANGYATKKESKSGRTIYVNTYEPFDKIRQAR